MELQQGFPLLTQQFRALFKKNLILAWRHLTATLLQLFSSLFFIFLIFCIQKATESQFATSTANKDLKDPNTLVFPPILPCEDKFFIKLPCWDFVYSGNDSPRIRSIVKSIRANNPGRNIPEDKIKDFKTKEEVDKWLYDNPMRCPGALHFMDGNKSSISYGLQTNSTSVEKRGRYEDPTFKFQIPLQIAAEREIARVLIGEPNFSWATNFKEYAHPALESFSAVGSIGPTFFLAIALFGFVLQMSALVTEKELKLRQAMTMMGLYDTAYWLSWLTWEGIICTISALMTVLFGMMFQFDFFLKNDFLVVYLLFFLFQINMIGYAFMLSAFINKAASATTVGFAIFIIGFITQLVTQFGFPYSPQYDSYYRFYWSLFPPNLFTKGLLLLAGATSTPQDPGISLSKIGRCSPNDTKCVMTMRDIYIWLASLFVVYFLLAIYYDNTVPNTAGVRKPYFYFLNPGYWSGKGGNKVIEGGLCSCTKSIPKLDEVIPDDVDVLEEEALVKKQAMEGLVDPDIAVSIRGLQKIYSGKTQVGCCRCKKTPHYQAVKGAWMNFPKDQLFCLLGPNGAGKTTTISCLTGIAPVTSGDALIYGESVCSSVGMTNIRRIIGVCPQFDILWAVLSGMEHLDLFASIKGLPPSTIKEVAETSLAEVRLTEAADRRAGSYSGGMKRRLSVAIALIGDPRLVILDEPTTGMDPITRRHVWDIIENAKKGRAIILTTHSMEEADILSDRIGIMAKGRLRCIGTSIRLKSRFGSGFIATVSFSGSANATPVSGDSSDSRNHEPVKKFFKDNLNVVPKEENKSFMTYIIPHDREEQLTNFFAELQDRENEFGISDIQLGLTTLEEVFLNISRQAELESAAADGTMTTLPLTSGSELQIPLGARYIGIPGTETAENPQGVMVEVYWEQDDSGSLCVSGHSPETPIPAHVQLQRLGQQGGLTRGLVIDPSQIDTRR